jgi:hypothetical protein
MLMSVYDLWLPILVTGIATHLLSTLAWMLLPHHRLEWQKIPAEEAFQDAIVAHNIGAGQYVFPFTQDMKEIKTEAFQKRQNTCQGMLVLRNSSLNMGAAILKTLTHFLVVAFVIGYLASLGLPAGAPFPKVVQFVTTAGLLTHCAAHFPHVFWFPRKIAMELIDGIVFSLATGLVFAAFWPAS